MNENTAVYFPISNPEKVETWGMNHYSISQVFKPKTEREIRNYFIMPTRINLKLPFGVVAVVTEMLL